MRAAAKQAQDEESLMRFLANKYVIKSMQPDGDCGYELMCRWKEIHAARKRGYSLSKKIIDEPIPEKEINAMRNAIAAEQERQINQKGNTFLQTLIGQSMLDWSRSPLENNGRKWRSGRCNSGSVCWDARNCLGKFITVFSSSFLSYKNWEERSFCRIPWDGGIQFANWKFPRTLPTRLLWVLPAVKVFQSWHRNTGLYWVCCAVLSYSDLATLKKRNDNKQAYK